MDNQEWQAPERNMDNIAFEDLRKQVEGKYNDVHDRLTAAYRNGGTFTQGELTLDFVALKESAAADAKSVFDRYHALIFYMMEVAFHEANMALPEEEQIPESKYRYELAEDGLTQIDKIANLQTLIQELKNNGVELVI